MGNPGWLSFARAVERLRQKAGYGSARAFFNKCGGAAYFGCGYRQYLNIEKARSAPGPKLMARIATALRLSESPDDAREFALAYLRSTLGPGELLELFVKSLGLAPPAAGTGKQSALIKGMARHFEARTKLLSQDQANLIWSSKELYWTFMILSNDGGAWNAQAIAEKTGLGAIAIAKALVRLEKAGLAAKDAYGNFKYPEPGEVLLYPRAAFYPKGMESLKEHWAAMERKRGQRMLDRHLFTRASEAEVKAFFPYLLQSLHAADVTTTTKPGPDTGFFVIETTVRKLLPF
jgi:hypothetical protein